MNKSFLSLIEDALSRSYSKIKNFDVINEVINSGQFSIEKWYAILKANELQDDNEEDWEEVKEEEKSEGNSMNDENYPGSEDMKVELHKSYEDSKDSNEMEEENHEDHMDILIENDGDINNNPLLNFPPIVNPFGNNYEETKEFSKLNLSCQHLFAILLILGTTDFKHYLNLKANSAKTQKICGKIFNPFEIHWFCKTCNKLKSSDIISVFCNNCFDRQIHKAHSYYFAISDNNEGCCDCGDIFSIQESGFCKLHSQKNIELPLRYFDNYTNNMSIQVLQFILHEENQNILNNPENPAPFLSNIVKILKFLIEVDQSKWILLILDCLKFRPKPLFNSNHECINKDSLKFNKICSCSIFENLVRSLPFAEKEDKYISDFFTELCRSNQEYGYEYVQAFLRVHSFLIKEYKKRYLQKWTFIAEILQQTEVSIPLCVQFISKNYLSLFFEPFKKTENLIINSKMIENTSTLIFLFFKDFQYLLNGSVQLSNFIISDQNFLNLYISMAKNLTYESLIPKRQNAIEYEIDGIDFYKILGHQYFVGIFRLLLSYSNVEKSIYKNIFQALVYYINQLVSEYIPNIEKLDSVLLTLLRIFSYFLTTVLDKFPESNSLLEYQKSLNNFLITEFEISQNELEILCLNISKLILRELVFLTEAESKYWYYYLNSIDFLLGYYFEELDYFCYYLDLFLFQFCIVFIPEKEIPKLFSDFILNDLKLKDLFIRDDSKYKQYLEIILYRWNSLMMNDISFIVIYTKLLTERNKWEIPIEIQEYYENCIRKLSVQHIISNEKHCESFSVEIVKYPLPVHILINDDEDYIKSKFITKLIGSKVYLFLNDDSIKFLNLFNLSSFQEFNSSIANIGKIIKKKIINTTNISLLMKISCPSRYVMFYKMVRYKMVQNDIFEHILRFFSQNIIEKNRISEICIEQFLFYILSSYINKENKELNLNIINGIIQVFTGLNFSGITLNQLFLKIKELIKFQKINENSMESATTSNKILQLQKNMKNQIIEEYQKKIKKFTIMNQNLFSDLENKSNNEYCVICKEPFVASHEKSNVYGELCNLTTSTLNGQIFGSNIIKVNLIFSDEIVSKKEEKSQLNYLLFQQDSVYLNSCEHKVHYLCFGKTVSFDKSFCPVCGIFVCEVLPYLTNPLMHYDSDAFLKYFRSIFHEEDKSLILPNLNYDNLCQDIEYFIVLFINMIFIEEMIGFKYNSLKKLMCLSKLFNYLISMDFSLLNVTEFIKFSKDILNTQSDKWNNEILLSLCISIIKDYILIFLNDSSLSLNHLSKIVDSHINISINAHIITLLFSHYCVFNKSRTLTLEKIWNVLENWKEYLDFLKLGLIKVMKKMLVVKVIFLSTISQVNLEELFSSKAFLTIEKESVNIIIEYLFKEFSLCPDIVENAILTSKKMLQSDPNSFIHYLEKELKIDCKYGSNSLIEKMTINKGLFIYGMEKEFNLIYLPESYDETLLLFANQNCKNCNQNCPNKCICLLCGTINCGYSKCCKMKSQGEVELHAEVLHFNNCYFLNLYKCQLIIFSGQAVANVQNLYINESGEDFAEFLKNESTIESKTAKNFYLNKIFYEELRENALRNGIEMHCMKSLSQGEGIEIEEAI